jgi:preprotein translocase subunit SecG
MTFFLVFLHILVCVALISVVLLQSGKGAEMGASFGASGSQSVFGAGGGNTFMSKMTTGAAIIFMLTSLTLAYRSGHTGTSSVMSGKAAQKAAPAQKSGPMGGMQSPAAPQQSPMQAPAAAPQQQTAPQTQPAAPAPVQKK